MKLNLKIKGKTQYNAKIEKAAAIVAEILGSKELEKFVLEYSFEKTFCKGFWRWKKCTTSKYKNFHMANSPNQLVLDSIQSGAESLSKERDGEIDLEIEVDHKYRSGVIGYTYPAIPTQYIYKWFIESASVEEIAGNIAHEYMHKLGFEHEFNRAPYRAYSVPYAIGYFVEAQAMKMGMKS